MSQPYIECSTSTPEPFGQHVTSLAHKGQLDQAATAFNTDPQHTSTLRSLDEEAFPEGGRSAWLSLLGCFCAWMSAFGLMNTVGTFQAYLGTHQLSEYSQAEIGWIFGLYLFMAYCCGVQTGPVFDAIGPRHLTAAGSVCLIASMFLLGACQRQYSISDNLQAVSTYAQQTNQ